jgi:RNA polymerase sigma-70 factor (ECF subfamily)
VDRAEEVVQATLCTALAQLGQYRGEAALLTWMTTICRRTLAASRLAEERVSATGAWLESLPGESEDAEARLSRQEMASRVHRVLDWLPAAYAEILAWKYFEEASVEEIARRLGVGLKAAESRLTRAREAFRREFSALVRSSVRDPEGRTCP